ncbi:MAG: IS91 family transposase [Spirochaetes bacterium]|nr:IS91 family transposase [Spirochaetota bacterium]
MDKISTFAHKNKQLNNVSKPELADILRGTISRLPKLPQSYWKVINDITACRTSRLGGHILKCEHCGHQVNLYNSCRNRHCPKCQTLAKARWLEKRMKELLPVNYYHIVFTLPDLLNPISLVNKKLVYNLLFKCVKETLLEAAGNPKNLGADIGFLTILHTWGQNLQFHPHIHCVVPAGGLHNNKWMHPKNNDFFISVKILSKLFRGKFLAYLKKNYQEKKISFHGKVCSQLEKDFNHLIDQLYKKNWVVYAKKPFGGPEKVLNYLGRYTHRIAISNNRIISYQNKNVTFYWKDYKDNNKRKIMLLSDTEFIRRFLLHILPENFVRIRSFGFLSNKSKKKKLSLCRKLLKVKVDKAEKLNWQELCLKLTGIDPGICDICNKGKFIVTGNIPEDKMWYDSS